MFVFMLQIILSITFYTGLNPNERKFVPIVTNTAVCRIITCMMLQNVLNKELKQAMNMFLFVKRVHSPETEPREKLICCIIAIM